MLTIFDKIRKETGWRVQFLNDELVQKWGWKEQEALQRQAQMSTIMAQQPNFSYQQASMGLPPAPPVKQPPKGIVNPLLARADFAQPVHPYQNYYVAPQGPNHYNHY